MCFGTLLFHSQPLHLSAPYLHRNFIGTSSEPHRNFTESLPYNNRHFAIPSHQSLHTSRSIPSFYSLLITVFGSVLAATVPRDLGYLEHLERLFFHFFFFLCIFLGRFEKKHYLCAQICAGGKCLS